MYTHLKRCDVFSAVLQNRVRGDAGDQLQRIAAFRPHEDLSKSIIIDVENWSQDTSDELPEDRSYTN